MKRNTVALVFGRKGQGKSYWIKRRLDAMARHAPLLVWDHNREYTGAAGVDPLRVVDFVGSWHEFIARQRASSGHLGRVVIHDDPRRFESFCRYALNAGGLTVVLDELHAYVTPTSYPEAFRLLFYVGRHRRIDVFAASWRPFGLPPFVRSCADEIRAFCTTEPNDLRWYAASCGESFASALPGLRPRRSLAWTPAGAASAPAS